jgi:hypothetical protein
MGQVKQRFLGANGLIVLLALLSAFVPLSTDLYLPALPDDGKEYPKMAHHSRGWEITYNIEAVRDWLLSQGRRQP